MSQDQLKQQAAEAAIEFVEQDAIVGVGTGSTVNYFINALIKMKNKIDGAVASSLATRERLQNAGIHIFDLNAVGTISLYVDGADEIDPHKQMIKGGGAALTGEKIVASAAEKFICIADESKYVDLLGKFPVPIEVIPMARSYVGRQLVQMNADPALRQGVKTDYGNVIIDAHNLKITDALALENALNNISGVVTNGIFAKRKADILLLARKNGVEKI
jgi:ribose 5-phosphate isomerase A